MFTFLIFIIHKSYRIHESMRLDMSEKASLLLNIWQARQERVCARGCI